MAALPERTFPFEWHARNEYVPEASDVIVPGEWGHLHSDPGLAGGCEPRGSWLPMVHMQHGVRSAFEACLEEPEREQPPCFRHLHADPAASSPGTPTGDSSEHGSNPSTQSPEGPPEPQAALDQLALQNWRLREENRLLKERAQLLAERKQLTSETTGWPSVPWSPMQDPVCLENQSPAGLGMEGSDYTQWNQVSMMLLPCCPVAQSQLWSGTPQRTPEESTPQKAAQKETAGYTARAHDMPTTVMLRNLPNNYTRTMLIQMLDDEGFGGLYDFVYFPMDFKSHAALGYAFVNLLSHKIAAAMMANFDGFSDWVLPTRKVCQVSWSTPHQGLKAHVQRYRNSPLMEDSVPDEYKPVVFRDGVRIPFPMRTAMGSTLKKAHHRGVRGHQGNQGSL